MKWWLTSIGRRLTGPPHISPLADEVARRSIGERGGIFNFNKLLFSLCPISLPFTCLTKKKLPSCWRPISLTLTFFKSRNSPPVDGQSLMITESDSIRDGRRAPCGLHLLGSQSLGKTQLCVSPSSSWISTLCLRAITTQTAEELDLKWCPSKSLRRGQIRNWCWW